MKKYFKLLLVLLAVPVLLTSCSNEADRDWTTPEASFKLYESTLETQVLYETMQNNPFTLGWDNQLGGAEYTVLVSATEDFQDPVTLGTATGSSYTGTIGELNTAVLQAGLSPYAAQKVYVKVVSGANSSNVISFTVTPYPSAAPVLTKPAAGTALVLDAENPDVVATTIEWTDYSYGTDVVYLVEMAKKGSAEYVTVGTVNNLKSLDVTNMQLAKLVYRLGATADVAAEYDVRVTATTSSTGGTINAVSNLVTISITPYQLESYLYALGSFNGWTHDTAEILTSLTSNGIYVGYINFPTDNGEFKITEGLNWDVNYGDSGADGTLDQNGDNIKVANAGYYKLTVDMNTKTFTLVPEVWGIIGSATPNDWNTPDTSMTWNGTTKTWETTVDLIVGEIKFRMNNSWDKNYGDNGNDGSLEDGGANIPVATAGTYKVILDLNNLTYSLVKQ